MDDEDRMKEMLYLWGATEIQVAMKFEMAQSSVRGNYKKLFYKNQWNIRVRGTGVEH